MSAVKRFYSERTIGPPIDLPPQSLRVGRTLTNLYGETGVVPNVAWTLNPRYHTMFRTRIYYEAYPESQEAVDAMAARMQRGRVIYDLETPFNFEGL